MPTHWKAHLKRLVPPRLLNATLLRFPALYETSLVQLESNLVHGGGARELLAALDECLEADVPGDIAECGSARCGTTVMLARRLQDRAPERRVLALDSFQGFHPDELARERAAGKTTVGDGAFQSFDLDYVRRKLTILGVNDRVELVPGYFEETLVQLHPPLCLALVDCDLYDSMLLCARHLWPLLSPGGWLVFDDYTADEFAGARLAVDEFVEEVADEVAAHRLGDRLYFMQKTAGEAA